MSPIHTQMQKGGDVTREKRDKDNQFSPAESKSRFEAALRSSKTVGHKEMKDISPKRMTPPERKRAEFEKKLKRMEKKIFED
jgi:hypothetical protein